MNTEVVADAPAAALPAENAPSWKDRKEWNEQPGGEENTCPGLVMGEGFKMRPSDAKSSMVGLPQHIGPMAEVLRGMNKAEAAASVLRAKAWLQCGGPASEQLLGVVDVSIVAPYGSPESAIAEYNGANVGSEHILA